MKPGAALDLLDTDTNRLWAVARKIESLGVLLERQDENEEGYTELLGFGMILSELSRELSELRGDLGQVFEALVRQN